MSSSARIAPETGSPRRARVQRRTLATVALAQVLGGAGLAAGATVGALLAEEMLGSEGLAGIPVGLFTLGSALAAYLVGWSSQRSGRRRGLTAGFVAGALGAVGVVVAATTEQLVLLLVALLVYGAGSATSLQARYAGTDLATPARRGRAVSIAMLATTGGAVAGPNLVEPLGTLAGSLGLPALTGPFLLAAAAYAAAGAVVWLLLRPDPLLLARDLERGAELGTSEPEPPVPPDATAAEVEAGSGSERSGSGSVGRGAAGAAVARELRPGAYVGAATMVLTQIAMVAIMTMTPVHMHRHGHDLGDVGLVISLHIAAMYLPSPVTGMLVDRVGRGATALASGAVLLLAGVTAALAPGASLTWTVLALMLLGLGWNLGLISGTAQVVDATGPADRPRVQGSIDVLVALAGAAGGVLSGVVVSATSFAVLGLGGGALALLLVPVLALGARRSDRLRAGGR